MGVFSVQHWKDMKIFIPFQTLRLKNIFPQKDRSQELVTTDCLFQSL